MPEYASQLTKTAASVLDGERFVAAMKCFPQGHTPPQGEALGVRRGRRAYSVASGTKDDHALDGELLPLEVAIGLTDTRAFVFRLSVMTSKAKLPPVKVVPLDVVTGVASCPGRTWNVRHTLIWLSLRDGSELALETAQRHKQNGEQCVDASLADGARRSTCRPERTAR